MFTRLRAMLRLLTRVGSAQRVLNNLNSYVRFCVLDSLAETGVFEYLTTPHTLEDTLENFGFIDDDFTRYVFEVLCNDKDGVLTCAGGMYQLNPATPIPTETQVRQQLPEMMWEITTSREHAAQIPARMRGEPIQFVERMEDQREALLTFDDTLASRIYDEGRAVCTIWARPWIGDLRGKTLLDIGCGSGREVAHLWTLFGGQVLITAIDPLGSFIDMSRERFPHMIKDLGGNQPLPPLTDANRPEFKVMDAVTLDFPDEHFDIVFHSGMLHWTADAGQAIREMARVLKPGGVLYGATSFKPTASGFVDLTIRLNDGPGGFPQYEDVVRWHQENGVEMDILVAGLYRARKTG